MQSCRRIGTCAILQEEERKKLIPSPLLAIINQRATLPHPHSPHRTHTLSKITNQEANWLLNMFVSSLLWSGCQALESNLSRAPVFKTAVTGVKETLMRGTILCLPSSMYTNSSSFFAVYKNPNSFWNDLVMSKSNVWQTTSMKFELCFWYPTVEIQLSLQGDPVGYQDTVTVEV